MISGRNLEGWIAMEKAQNQALHRDRRERIATAALAGMMANKSYNDATYSGFVRSAVIAADALIAELDKKEGDKS
jgi:hypothetical protein